MKSEAILISIVPALLVAVGTAIQQLATDNTTTGILAAVAALLIAVGGIVARMRVYSERSVEELTAPTKHPVAR